MKVDISQSEVTILIEFDGEVCAVMMDSDKNDVISLLVKQSVDRLVKTGKTQLDLNKFLLPVFYKEDKQ